MSILEDYPKATPEQQAELLKSEKEWEEDIMAIKIPEQDKPTLSSGTDMAFKDITDKYREKVKKIMNL